MLRQLNQDKVTLDAANAALSQQVQDLEVRLKATEARQQAQMQRLEAQVQTQQRENAGLRDRIVGDGERLRVFSSRSRAMADELARWRRDNALLLHAVEERTIWGNACLAKNRDAIRLNRELLEHQSDRGFWESLKATEPLTGLGRVSEENTRDEFSYRLEDLEVTPMQAQPVSQGLDSDRPGYGEEDEEGD